MEKLFKCVCGHEVLADKPPPPILWTDGHTCYLIGVPFVTRGGPSMSTDPIRQVPDIVFISSGDILPGAKLNAHKIKVSLSKVIDEPGLTCYQCYGPAADSYIPPPTRPATHALFKIALPDGALWYMIKLTDYDYTALLDVVETITNRPAEAQLIVLSITALLLAAPEFRGGKNNVKTND